MPESLETRLEWAAVNQQAYYPNTATTEFMQTIALHMFVAPPAAGKTTIMREVAALDETFGMAVTDTTRQPRIDEDEADLFVYANSDEKKRALLDDIEQGNVCHYVVHPTTHQIYSNKPSGYKKAHNLLAVLSNIVEPLRQLPYGQTTVTGLVPASARDYQTWFESRYPEANDEKLKRITEAIRSLEWLIAQPEGSIHWLVNRPGDPQETARQYIRLLELDDHSYNGRARKTARNCLAMARFIQERTRLAL